MRYKDIPRCKTCGQQFDNIFEAVAHMSDDENAPVFDPKLILPGGYQLLIGTLLKSIYDNAGRNQAVKDIVSHTYATLYAAETSPRRMKRFIEDLIVSEEMSNFEDDIMEFLNNYKDKGKDEK